MGQDIPIRNFIRDIPSKLEEKPWRTLTYFESRVLDATKGS